ncbi:MAG: hypothetical protein M3297_07060 [Thermoproteota archaeon]|nr:hypothetical protein [Thermoproteota archaeon]
MITEKSEDISNPEWCAFTTEAGSDLLDYQTAVNYYFGFRNTPHIISS